LEVNDAGWERQFEEKTTSPGARLKGTTGKILFMMLANLLESMRIEPPIHILSTSL
jgi:hypothetical protein